MKTIFIEGLSFDLEKCEEEEQFSYSINFILNIIPKTECNKHIERL